MMDTKNKIEPMKTAPIRSSSQGQLPKKLRNPADRDFDAELKQASVATQMMGGQLPQSSVNSAPQPESQSSEDSVVKGFSYQGDSAANSNMSQGINPNGNVFGTQVGTQM